MKKHTQKQAVTMQENSRYMLKGAVVGHGCTAEPCYKSPKHTPTAAVSKFSRRMVRGDPMIQSQHINIHHKLVGLLLVCCECSHLFPCYRHIKPLVSSPLYDRQPQTPA